jgi:threonine aldolase
MKYKKSFASDNNSGVHPIILKAIEKANVGSFVSYGDDDYTKEAKKMFKNLFGKQSETFFVLTGTGANVTALQALNDRFSCIFAAETAHINVDECGAPEHILGSKIISLKTKNGKINCNDITPYLHYTGDQHHSQPRTISISQSTELGSVYTINEIKQITKYAKEHNLYVHLDGARLANALVNLKCSIKELTTDCGIDIVSFGGTKNGMMMGEAVVVLNTNLVKNLAFIRKQNMQLFSKMRYVTAQYIEYFKDNLYLENARNANTMATYLYQCLKKRLPEIITDKPQSNAVFVKIANKTAKILQKERYFYVWDEDNEIYRFMTSFDMTKEDIDDFVEFLYKGIKK